MDRKGACASGWPQPLPKQESPPRLRFNLTHTGDRGTLINLPQNAAPWRPAFRPYRQFELCCIVRQFWIAFYETTMTNGQRIDSTGLNDISTTLFVKNWKLNLPKIQNITLVRKTSESEQSIRIDLLWFFFQ